VSTIHTGAYDSLPEAHAALEGWLESRDLRAAGAVWEVYVTDPGQVPDPSEWKTEVICPLAE